MTNGKEMGVNCVCLWENGKVVSFCGAHTEHHHELIEPTMQKLAELELIIAYAKNEHPMLSSRPCPLCEWDSTVENGIWKGQNRKPCSYHYALHQLYKIKIEGQDES